MGLLKISVEPVSGGTSKGDKDTSSKGAGLEGEQISVKSGSVSHVYPLGEELLNTVSTEGLRNFQWYFERYLIDEPFAFARAQVIQRRLQSQGKLILKEFLLPEVCRRPDRSDEILIEIQLASDAGSRNSSLHRFFWEILEDQGLWYEVFGIKPQTVTVVRVCRPDDNLEADGNLGKTFSDANPRMKNILAITARPSHIRDIPHRLITRSISAAISQTFDQSEPQASLEIVRPSTFEAFAGHLAKHVKGHYEIVHLDLHGGTDNQGYVSCPAVHRMSDTN